MGNLLAKNFVKNMNYLRSKQNPQFYLNIVALHGQGWSLQEIADSFEVSKSAVANWEKKGKSITDPDELQQLLYDIPAKPQKPQVALKAPKPAQPSLSISEQQEILKLAQMASKVSRNTAPNAPSRIAAAKLEAHLYYYHVKVGVSLSKLAAAAGVTRRAIAQRLEKEKARQIITTEEKKDVKVNVSFSATSGIS
jgi:predicted DNA-binding protein YlxM (UPF0122 family)